MGDVQENNSVYCYLVQRNVDLIETYAVLDGDDKTDLDKRLKRRWCLANNCGYDCKYTPDHPGSKRDGLDKLTLQGI